jgi:ubiquinone/menaquinone biosynthesis C-methylase UbiE
VVADVGVGTGYFALPLAERLENGRVLGLDIEPRMLEVVRERAREQGLEQKLELFEMTDPHTIPVPDRTLDAALMVSLYHELDDRPRLLAELGRALRAGGVLAVVDWRLEGATDHGPRPQHRVAVEVALRELAEAGFEQTQQHWIYQDHWVVTGRAPELSSSPAS